MSDYAQFAGLDRLINEPTTHVERMALTEHRRRMDLVERLTVGGWDLVIDPALKDGEFYVDQSSKRAYLNNYTYQLLAHSSEAFERFVGTDMREGGGMKRLVTDAGPYREAALAEARAKGVDEPARTDTLVALRRRADALLAQAASLNTRPTPGQVEVFSIHLAELREAYAQVRQQVADLGNLVDLAEVAVIDAMDND